MARDIMGPDFAMLGMLGFLLIAGDSVVSIKDGLSGFRCAPAGLTPTCQLQVHAGSRYPPGPNSTD